MIKTYWNEKWRWKRCHEKQLAHNNEMMCTRAYLFLYRYIYILAVCFNRMECSLHSESCSGTIDEKRQTLKICAFYWASFWFDSKFLLAFKWIALRNKLFVTSGNDIFSFVLSLCISERIESPRFFTSIVVPLKLYTFSNRYKL